MNGEGDSGRSGYGTHSVALLLELAPKVKTYVAQVVEARSGRVEAETVAEVKVCRFLSISWAAMTENRQGHQVRDSDLESRHHHHLVRPVAEAIDIASSQNVILFAAASNSGSNQPIAFPANCPPEICVHSADGYGNPSRFTLVDGPNFAVIGEAISSSWPQTRDEGREKCKWGTSTSTPILAAIAALVLEFTHQKPSRSPLELRLRSPRGMTQILLA